MPEQQTNDCANCGHRHPSSSPSRSLYETINLYWIQVQDIDDHLESDFREERDDKEEQRQPRIISCSRRESLISGKREAIKPSVSCIRKRRRKRLPKKLRFDENTKVIYYEPPTEAEKSALFYSEIEEILMQIKALREKSTFRTSKYV